MNRVEKVDDLVPIRNVLISLSNKEGLKNLALGLLKINPDIRFYSTGGTYKAWKKSWVRGVQISLASATTPVSLKCRAD
jgi:AICAR transformylase/IMP cyclohydrolase PurH